MAGKVVNLGGANYITDKSNNFSMVKLKIEA